MSQPEIGEEDLKDLDDHIWDVVEEAITHFYTFKDIAAALRKAAARLESGDVPS